MKNRFLSLFLLIAFTATAQLPEDFRSEQIYLNPEKHVYMPGDTINLEGMVTCLASDQNLPFSNYLYIECFDNTDSLLIRQKVNCKDEGYFNTRIPTDYLWPAGVYYFRAYTQLMRNFTTESFALQPFLLAKEFPKKEGRVYEARCTIIPSGGRLVAGYMQTLTVLLTDQCTFPISADLVLMNEHGDTIMPIKTSLSGMAMLNFIPQAKTKYHLEAEVDGTDYEFPLPEKTAEIKVQGTLNGKRLIFQILNADVDIDQYRLYAYDRMNGLTMLPEIKQEGIVFLNKEPQVLSLFLADDKLTVLSEATLANRYQMQGNLYASDTIAVGDSISFRLSEIPAGSKIMAKIVCDNDLLVTHAETELNYISDFSSRLPYPSRMYTGNAIERNRDLHAWLSSATFKRFSLKEAVEKGTDIYSYMPEEVLNFTGWIEKKSLRPMSNGQLVAYHTENDFVYDVNLNEEGRFRIAVDDFWEGEQFFLQAITSKGKPDFANYHVDDETFPALTNKRRFRLPVSRYADTEVTIGNMLDLQYTVGKDKVRNYTLPNVTVKARLKTDKEVPTNKFYSTNYADREEIEERAYGTLYDILRDMPGIVVRQTEEDSNEDPGHKPIESAIALSFLSKGPTDTKQIIQRTWVIETTRGVSTLGGTNSLPVLVDGVKYRKSDLDFILFMPAAEIESAELLRPWQALAYTSGAIDGAVLVKTRAYKDRPPLPSKGAMYMPTGLAKLDGTFVRKPWIADKPGLYRLVVDVITDAGVRSYERPFRVVE